MSAHHRVFWSFAPARLVGARRAVALLVTALSLGLTACGDDDKNPTGNNNAAIGLYDMVEVDDVDVPTSIAQLDGGETLVSLLSGSINLKSGSAFDLEYTLRYQGAQDGDLDVQGSGTYSVSGNQLTLTIGGESTTATLSNGRITVNDVVLIEEAPSLEYKVELQK